MATLQDARDYRQLLESGDEQSPYLFDHIFANRGWSARPNARFKLLRRIDESLRAMLQADEQVFFVTQGVVSPSIAERFFLGSMTYYVNRRAIVLTNRRILLLQINSRRKPRDLRFEIHYEAVAEVRRSFFLGNTEIRLGNGDRLFFTAIRRVDRQYLAELIKKLRDEVAMATEHRGLENLCPHCYALVADRGPQCPHCGNPFKSARIAALLSLVFPGAGGFYLGHHGVATLEIVGGLMLWLVVLVIALDPTMGPAELASVLVVIGFVHGSDAVLTQHVANKGLYPASTEYYRSRFVTAAIVPVLVILTAISQVSKKQGVVSAATAVPGAAVPTSHIDALRADGLIRPDETVLYFFSAGPSVLKEGNLLTNERIISYSRLPEDSNYYAEARYQDVLDLHAEYATAPSDLSDIYVATAQGEVFLLVVSPREAGDTLFAATLWDRWRAVREAGPAGTAWYDGGDGISDAEPILLRGISADAASTAERIWLALWFGPEGAAWQLLAESRRPLDDREIDEVHVGFPDGSSQRFYFEVPQR